MKLSPDGVKQLRVEEGVRLKAYRDQTGRWTIGVGQTTLRGRPVEEGDVLTPSELTEAFEQLRGEFEAALSDAVKVPVTQAQFDALFSWTWNVGIAAMRGSTLIRKLNAGDFRGAAAEFLRWDKQTVRGELVVSEELHARRERERRAFEADIQELTVPDNTNFGGPAADPAAASQPIPPAVKSVAAVAAKALLPGLLGVVPDLVKIFTDKTTPVNERNVAAAVKTFEVLGNAMGTSSAEETVAKVNSDPAAAVTAREAVREKFLEIQEMAEIGGGVAAARAADLAFAQSGSRLRDSPSFIIALILLANVTLVIFALMFPAVSGVKWAEAAVVGVVGAFMGAVVGGLIGYYYGEKTSRNKVGG